MARADGTSSLPTSADNPQPPRPGSVQLVDGASANESTPRRPSLLPVEETREVAAYSRPRVHPRKRFALRCPADPRKSARFAGRTKTRLNAAAS
jgi:hypothetical protein